MIFLSNMHIVCFHHFPPLQATEIATTAHGIPLDCAARIYQALYAALRAQLSPEEVFDGKNIILTLRCTIRAVTTAAFS
jgi:hypothetical protein